MALAIKQVGKKFAVYDTATGIEKRPRWDEERYALKQKQTYERQTGRSLPIDEPLHDGVSSITDGDVCPDCGRVCKSSLGLRSHRRVHSKE